MSAVDSFFLLLILFCYAVCNNGGNETRAMRLFNIRGSSDYYLDIESANANNKHNEKYLICHACPPGNPNEENFVQEKSLTRKSLFVRLITSETDNNEKTICHGSFKPAVIFERSSKNFETGYEIYYSAAVKTGDSISRLLFHAKNRYKGIEVRPNSDNNLSWNFFERNSWGELYDFIWVSILSIKFDSERFSPLQITNTHKISKSTTSIKLCTRFSLGEELYGNMDIGSLYDDENQISMFEDFDLPPKLETFERNVSREQPKLSCGQEYGCLMKHQLVPEDYFDSYDARMATCSYLNTFPMWKSIAEGQWYKVEEYIRLVNKYIDNIRVISGTAGILSFDDSTPENNLKQMYLGYKLNIIPVPRFIFKIVEFKFQLPKKKLLNYVIVIVTHNDPTQFGLVHQVCKPSICKHNGWYINNEKSELGHTYCCLLDDKVKKKLGIKYEEEIYRDFNLKEVPFMNGKIKEVRDISQKIVDEFLGN